MLSAMSLTGSLEENEENRKGEMGMSDEFRKNSQSDQTENGIWADIRKKTGEVKYGSVTITLHDGRIVQVETNTKTRY